MNTDSLSRHSISGANDVAQWASPFELTTHVQPDARPPAELTLISGAQAAADEPLLALSAARTAAASLTRAAAPGGAQPGVSRLEGVPPEVIVRVILGFLSHLHQMALAGSSSHLQRVVTSSPLYWPTRLMVRDLNASYIALRRDAEEQRFLWSEGGLEVRLQAMLDGESIAPLQDPNMRLERGQIVLSTEGLRTVESLLVRVSPAHLALLQQCDAYSARIAAGETTALPEPEVTDFLARLPSRFAANPHHAQVLMAFTASDNGNHARLLGELQDIRRSIVLQAFDAFLRQDVMAFRSGS